MRRKRKKKISTKHKFAVGFLVIIIVGWVFFSMKTESAVGPIARQQAEYFSKQIANEIISDTVSDYIKANQYTYSDFAAVLYDENGKAVSIEMLTFNVNKVQAELTSEINRRLETSKSISAEIPLGSLTESYLLAGRGPKISLKICPASEVSVELSESFGEAGINQTCHRISANIHAEIKSSVPLYSFSTEADFEFLLAESVIVGDIPMLSVHNSLKTIEKF